MSHIFCRQQCEPSEALLALLWPDIDEILLRMRNEMPTSQASRRGQQTSRRADFDWSAYGFAKALKLLRRSFLQDSVYLKEDQPDHHIWEHPLFETPEYLEFEKQMKAHMETSMAARRRPNLDEVSSNYIVRLILAIP